MIGLLVAIAMVAIALGTFVALADSALRWWSAFSMLRARLFDASGYETLHSPLAHTHAGFLQRNNLAS